MHKIAPLRPNLIPVNIFGTADGTITVKNTLIFFAPMQDAASISDGSVATTPAIVLTRIWKNAP